MRPDDSGRVGLVSRVGQTGRVDWVGRGIGLAVLPLLAYLASLPDPRGLLGPVVAAQTSFEEATRNLKSADASVRVRAVQQLQETAYEEAALPLAPLVNDPKDEVQVAAIAAELNIFLAEPVVPRRRVGFVVEVRNAVAAEAAFTAGPFALGPRAVPAEVLAALRLGARDDNPRVGLEALYAFGVLAAQPSGAARRELLRASGPEIAPLIGASDPAQRYAAARVIGRLFAKRAEDGPIEETVGDILITALNDDDRAVKAAAMQALGTMRYERGVQALTDLYTYHGSNQSAEAALDALAHIAHPSSAELFAAALSGKSTPLRVLAIEGLARIGDDSKLPAIQAAVDADRNDAVALAGVYASARLANQRFDRIADALTRGRLRLQARQYLIELLPGRVSAVTSQVQDPDARLRLEIVELLGVTGDPAALPLVEPLLTDREPPVARAAERAVARLKKAP
jgi:HEAT repeat protein